MVKIIECPRDALQGLTDFVPTQSKIEYINQLLRVGFDTLDFGSFVSPKTIPQMKDTREVLNNLQTGDSTTKLLAIVANTRGGEEAAQLSGISYLGFPLSISETFQQRNTNKSITDALNTVNDLMELCTKHKKELVVYLSMGFGNPYGDPYDSNMVVSFSGILKSIGIKIISVADTIGISTVDQIKSTINNLNAAFDSGVEFGIHLHSNPIHSKEKIQAAYESGCRRFDGALLGYGGCPMAEDKLVGNINTIDILDVLESKGHSEMINQVELEKAKLMAREIFNGKA